MFDFDIQRCTRRCAATDRELQPGEVFYSALVAEGSDVVRRDFTESAWQGQPDSAIGWWKSRMPDAVPQRLHFAPNDVLLHYFEQLAEDVEKRDVRYILALLLVRRRIMRLEDTEQAEGESEHLVLFCPRNDSEYRVQVVDPVPERVQQIQNELATLLFADAA